MPEEEDMPDRHSEGAFRNFPLGRMLSINHQGLIDIKLYIHSQDEKIFKAGVLIEPFTWGWIALKICEGILAAIGAKIFANIFGDKAEKIDLQQLILQFASIVQQLIRQELAVEAKRNAEASLSSLRSLFLMYLNNKDKMFLTQLIFKSNELSEQFASLGLPVVAGFGVCGTLELVVIQERYLVSHSVGEKINLSVRAGELIERGKSFTSRLELFNQSRFSALYFLEWIGFRYDCDGQQIPISSIGAPVRPWEAVQAYCEKVRQDHIAREYARLEKDILFPLYAVMDQWKVIMEKK